MAKIIGVIVNGIEYDPENVPQQVISELQDRMMAVYEKEMEETNE